MENKKKINKLIYNSTKYFNKSTIYPTLTDLIYLLKDIIKLNETTEYIVVTPFYINEKLNFQEEFDFNGFYVECRKSVTKEEAENFWKEQIFWSEPDSEYKILEKYVTDNDLKKTKFLCQEDDVESFQKALQTYIDFLLEEGIEGLMWWLYDLCNVTDRDLPYGYFCFEVRYK